VKSSIQETDEFVVQIQKGRYTEKMPVNNFGRNNIGAYNEFIYDSMHRNQNNTAMTSDMITIDKPYNKDK